MTGIALLAREQGYRVTGMDDHPYPPMSEILAQQGIEIIGGYEFSLLPPADIYIIGNVMRRGMPLIEELLNENRPYISAPQWLAENVLAEREVFAVAGTHGKTTTTALLTKMLAEREPGYLIGGAANDFNLPARLGAGKEFVLEADEYDSAFFDKRAKFIHYHPTRLIIMNLEYDHADIFPDMVAIQREFRHLLRTVPARGTVFFDLSSPALMSVLAAECRSQRHGMRLISQDEKIHRTVGRSEEDGDLWCIDRHSSLAKDLKSSWRIRHFVPTGELDEELDIGWQFFGEHNALNLLAATAAARSAGIDSATITRAAREFTGVARRLQKVGTFGGVRLISDFAHHPTAIKATLAAVREQQAGSTGRILAIVELASHSMRMRVHRNMDAAVAGADETLWFLSRTDGSGGTVQSKLRRVYTQADRLIAHLVRRARPQDTIVLMSNGSVEGLLTEIAQALTASI